MPERAKGGGGAIDLSPPERELPLREPLPGESEGNEVAPTPAPLPAAETPPPPRRNPLARCNNHVERQELVSKYARALRRYALDKVRSVLERQYQRVKDGMTLSQLFPDYRDYRLVVRIERHRDVDAQDQILQKDFYAFKEGDKIVMAPDIMWMADDEKERTIRALIAAARPQWTPDAYAREAEKTLEVAAKSAFKLDCKHVGELDGLLAHSVEEMKKSEDSRIISPPRFGSLLTILRGYITFNYYKDLSHQEFDERFRDMVQRLGSQSWAHQKLSRLLGLHVMGRIESNYDFRRTYDTAITHAAGRYPQVPRRWIEEIIWIESRGDPKCISRAGAYGVMQLMPLVYLGMGPDKAPLYPLAFETTINPFDAAGNIERGAAFLHKLQQLMLPHIVKYDAETRRRIIFHAYNAGVSRVLDLVRKHGRAYEQHLPEETRAYLDRLTDFPRTNASAGN